MHPIVIRFGRVGDMVLLAPLLHRLHRGYGEPCVVLGSGPWTSALYAAHPDVARVLQVANRHRPLALSPPRWRMTDTLRRCRDAAVHVCEPEPRPLAKIRRMLAIARVDSARCVFITGASTQPDEHWVDRLLRACGGPPAACAGAWQPPAAPDERAPKLYLCAADRVDRDAWLRTRGWRGEPIWLVQPCSHGSGRRSAPPGADRKTWPRDRWISTLRAMRARHPDARIVLCGAPGEAVAMDALAAAAQLDRLDVAARDLPLRRLMALADIAQGMLSVDTGPAHVAAALGCPLVVLFGEQAPAVWCPRSPTDTVVCALGGAPRHARVLEIGTDEVLAALTGLTPRGADPTRAA